MDVKEKDEIKETKPKKKNVLLKLFMGFSIKTKIIILLVIVISIMGCFILLTSGGEREIIITAKSTLEKIVEVDKLQTVEYTYDAVVGKCKKEDCKNSNKLNDYEYFVNYKGTVTAGIEFEKIKFDVKDNKVIITLPEVKILKYTVKDDKTNMDFIFSSDKYNQANKLAEIEKLAEADLKMI